MHLPRMHYKYTCILHFIVRRCRPMARCSTQDTTLQAIKILRAFRLVRLVRVIARSPSMLTVAQSISLSLKEMSNVVLIVLLIITIFAILGVQLFAGKLWSCNDASVTGKADCNGVSPSARKSLLRKHNPGLGR
jgi:hypothetical protein